MKKTTEYFKMDKNDLLAIKNEYGYTKEDCLILDSACKVSFLSDIQDIQEHENYMKSTYNMLCDDILITLDGRYALLYN